jgi:hypothetical protein
MRFVRAMILAAFAIVAFAISAPAQETVALYSPLQYKNDHSRANFNFITGETPKRYAPWHLAYGLLRAGDDFDWFQSAGAGSNRGLIRDLGELKWTDYFDIPVIEPLPKLKPGEQRTITVDTSGADGADGAPGADGDGVVRIRPNDTRHSRPKHDGKPRIDPIFVKAVVGHLYAIHVVNDTQDFYALFRVESVTRGDNVTISWRLVPAPISKAIPKEM